ncbi:DUF616 domain-containing protein [Roseateles sp. DAIF2]|uniref:glycosyltransferase domain-containing protein n=1 Tax=Roseateles sp. DAIF2 TaxID=2714952 RepID=UPI0018A2A1D3|nr:glycosyltransferase domain-containing protein [Roseateles sp. DAIF2]QPF73762.1 DUF616 domain-containing protein [Roseateles sp. DAIF2]
MTRQRLVIYTVLTGAKEALGNPLAALPPGASSDLQIDWVCFTDNPRLRSEVWQLRDIGAHPLPSEKLSRRPKALPHEYLQDWDYSLYIDNITVFKRLPQAADLASAGPYLFKVFRHASRVNPRQEAAAIVQLGYESAERICGQLDFYAKLGPLEGITPLSTCTVILRQHGHPALQRFGVTWWEQILNFGKRDQMSFDFAVQHSGARLEHLPGLKNDSDLIHNTANIHPGRVHANFDAVRYAWLHRGDAAAQADPRQHYLDHGRHEGRDYAARPELLEFLCHHHGSSLGARIAPRRQVAGALQDLLAPRRERAGRLLLLRIQDEGAPAAYEPAECDAAEAALGAYLPAHRGVKIDIAAAALAAGNLVYEPQDGGFDLVLVLGLPGPLLPRLAGLLGAALKPESGGLLCVLASRPCAAAEVAQLEAALAARLGRPCRAGLQASRHDGLERALPNSLLALEW